VVHRFTQKQSRILKTLVLRLDPLHVHLGNRFIPEHPSAVIGKQIFDEEIFPRLTPPEQFLPSQLEKLDNLQIGVIFERLFWFRIPRSLPTLYCRWSAEQNKLYCYFLDELLSLHLGPAFQLKNSPILLRLTRDGDYKVDLEEEDTESIPDIVRTRLGSREKGRPMRLQYSPKLPTDFLNECLKTLKLTSQQTVEAPTTLCLHGIANIRSHLPESISTSPTLCYHPMKSIIPKPFRQPKQIFDRLDLEDLLLHHPYDSFDAYVSWIRAACEDPYVTQIEQTIYRMDTLSPVIELLKSVAHQKRVRVIIELRARFDELNNLRLADELKKAGVEVAFGFGQLKLHGKVALVTRVKEGQEKLYAHLSTGNYNATTARQYTDLSILTARPEICTDVRYFIDKIWVGEVPNDFKTLLSAPNQLHRRMISHIQAETEAALKGKKARIVAKVNALVDDHVVQHLYRASQAGVHVDLIVRGACSLVPGIKGLSENIRVISIIDRFLEHSRIYYFGNARKLYLSSADWMPRNFFSRLEIAFPILDPYLYRYIEEIIIPAYLSDTVKAHVLSPEGKWKRRRSTASTQDSSFIKFMHNGEKGVRSQFLFEEIAEREYEGTPLWRKVYSHL
jgi:polyphosphate kinase